MHGGQGEGHLLWSNEHVLEESDQWTVLCTASVRSGRSPHEPLLWLECGL